VMLLEPGGRTVARIGRPSGWMAIDGWDCPWSIPIDCNGSPVG